MLMPYPARATVLSLTRYATPSRGANWPLPTSTPASVGTFPSPPTYTLSVTGS